MRTLNEVLDGFTIVHEERAALYIELREFMQRYEKLVTRKLIAAAIFDYACWFLFGIITAWLILKYHG